MRKRSTIRTGSIIFGAILLIGLIGIIWFVGDLPDIADLPERLAAPSVRITDRHGRTLYEAYPEEGGRHTEVSLEEIPNALLQATIATEDSNFYQNPGVDLLGILRAVWINLRGGETLAGGSTITQQVARNLLLDPDEVLERSIRRKLRESLLAWQLARHYSKDEVLALYLNQMNYGGLAYGVEAAAQTYFGKSVSELDLAECALLAGLTQAPALYNPLVYPEAAKARQLTVLELMEKQGLINSEIQALAGREPLVYTSAPYPIHAPHFVMMILAQLDGLLPAEERSQYGGLIVRSTLDLDWQNQAQRAIERQFKALNEANDLSGGQRLPGWHNVNNAALVALDPHTGEILALVGNPDYFDQAHSGAINMALAPRQPGSALKPLVYAVAIDPQRSQVWTAATMILDVRTTFTTHEGTPYTPANYDGLEHGPVLVREALASSLNIPAVATLDHIGMEALFQLASNLGIDTFGDPDNYDLSLALGGGEVRLLDLTAAYAAFANRGHRIQPYSLLEITTSTGEILYTAEPLSPIQVIDERVAWLISDILSDNQARTPGFGANSALRIDRPAAVKTGTTTNFHDNWTIGFTPHLVVGVWVGNASHEPMRDVTGLSGAAPIWHQFIRGVLSGEPEEAFTRPEDMVRVEVCSLSGLLPSEDCPYRRNEWFIPGTEPTEIDTIYHRVTIDFATGLLADENTPQSRQASLTVLDLPLEAHAWARSQGLTLLSDLLARGISTLPDLDPGVSSGGSPLRIISPAQNTIYRLSPSLATQAQRIHIAALCDTKVNVISFWMDGEEIAQANQPPFETWWPLEVGLHQVWAEAQTTDGGFISSEVVSFKVTTGEDE
jgi:penicillin-binding protein 1C